MFVRPLINMSIIVHYKKSLTSNGNISAVAKNPLECGHIPTGNKIPLECKRESKYFFCFPKKIHISTGGHTLGWV